jgi:hypothetical protein
MIKSLLKGLIVAALLIVPVWAQTSPGFYTGQVPTAAQWNTAFINKQDALGFQPLNVAGGTMSGKLTTAASIAGAAGLNLPPGTAPSIPANGDMWTTSANLFARVNGITYNLTGAGGGSTPSTVNLNSGSLTTAQTGTLFQGQAADSTAARFEADAFGAIAAFTGVIYGGTRASPTAVTSGTQLSGINAYAYNGASVVGPIVSFRTYAGENIASGHQGSKACIAVTPNASTTLADQACVFPDGHMFLGDQTASDFGQFVVKPTSSSIIPIDAEKIGTNGGGSGIALNLGSDGATVGDVTQIQFGAIDSLPSNYYYGSMGIKLQTVTFGSETAAFTWNLAFSNVFALRMQLDSTGLTINPTSTGTAADVLCMTSAKLVILQAAGSCTISKRELKNWYPFTATVLPSILNTELDMFQFKDWKKNEDRNAKTYQAGFMADNVAKLFKECALYEKDMKTPKGYRPECMIAISFKGIKEEHDARIAEERLFEYRIERLEALIHGRH